MGPAIQNGGGLTAYNQPYGANATARAGALIAVGYLPLHLSWLDTFGKVGIADLHSTGNTSGIYPNTFYSTTPAPCGPVGLSSSSERNNHVGYAYGGGVKPNFEQLSLRLEYEGIDSGIRGTRSWHPSV